MFCGLVSAEIIGPRSVTLVDWRGVMSLATVNALLYKPGVTLPTAPVAACLSQGVDYFSQFKSSQYSYRSYVMKLHILNKFYALMLVLFIRKQKQAPNLVMFQFFQYAPDVID